MAKKNAYWVTIIDSHGAPKQVNVNDFSIIEALQDIVTNFGNVLIRSFGFKGDKLVNDILIPSTELITSDVIPASPATVTSSAKTATTIVFSGVAVANATFYEYDVNGADGVQCKATDFPITITGLTTATPYTIRLRAGNGAGMSAWNTGLVVTTS